jgi:hypothetical protein
LSGPFIAALSALPSPQSLVRRSIAKKTAAIQAATAAHAAHSPLLMNSADEGVYVVADPDKGGIQPERSTERTEEYGS